METESNIVIQIWIWLINLNGGNVEFSGMKLWQHLDLFHIVQDCPFLPWGSSSPNRSVWFKGWQLTFRTQVLILSACWQVSKRRLSCETKGKTTKLCWRGDQRLIHATTQSAGGWQICTQRESGTWFLLPGTPGEGCRCRTGKLCRPPLPVQGGGKERGTTWPRLLGVVHLRGGLSSAPGLCSG